MKILLLIILSAIACQGLNCTEQYQCYPAVSNDYNFVSCVAGQCVCLYKQGFTGAATVSSPCTCASPNVVEWAGNPYCVNVPSFSRLAIQQWQISQVELIYQYTIGINTALGVATGLVPLPPIFSPNCTGRINSVGNLDCLTFQEFFYALSANSNVTGFNAVEAISVGNVVSTRIDVFTNELPSPQSNITQTGFWYFNPITNLIEKIDISFLNLGSRNNRDLSIPYNVAYGICEVSTAFCTGLHQQFNSFSSCMNYMTNTSLVLVGNFDQIKSKSLACYALLADVTAVKASVGDFSHCVDIGENSNICTGPITEAYDTYYSNDIVNPFPSAA
jgi:hypothetical protein